MERVRPSAPPPDLPALSCPQACLSTRGSDLLPRVGLCAGPCSDSLASRGLGPLH